IEVRNAGLGGFTVLTPRQELTATPHAQGLALPLNETIGSVNALVSLTNTGSGDGILVNTSGGGITTGGVSAVAGGSNSNGLVGIANNGGMAYGVWGQSSTGYGVVGAGLAYGGYFLGNTGVFGTSGLSGTGIGVQGTGGSGNIGVRGDSSAGGQ